MPRPADQDGRRSAEPRAQRDTAAAHVTAQLAAHRQRLVQYEAQTRFRALRSYLRQVEERLAALEDGLPRSRGHR
jgi:hypothetical protein